MSLADTALPQDAMLAGDVITHLDAQLASARHLLQLVLEQGAAIRRRDVRGVVALTGLLQAELQRRQLLEDERSRLLDRAAARLGISPAAVTLSALEKLMDEPMGEKAGVRSAELRGLLEELRREHHVNRVLMSQELAFLDHLLRLTDGPADAGYEADLGRPRLAAAIAAAERRVLDLEA